MKNCQGQLCKLKVDMKNKIKYKYNLYYIIFCMKITYYIIYIKIY